MDVVVSAAGLRIGTVVNLPLTHLSELSAKLDPTQPVVAVCNSAYRSSMAVGILERKGFKQVGSLAGGSEAWISAGLPVFGADQKTGAGSPASATPPKRTVKLPERIAASELKSLIMDLPGTFDLVVEAHLSLGGIAVEVRALDLPHASTGCNQCGAVCPVSIPLPSLMHRLREIQNERALRPLSERLALRAWGWLARHPGMYRWLTRRVARYLRWLADDSGRIRVLGLAPGWTAGRDLPAPPGKTFHELYAARKRA